MSDGLIDLSVYRGRFPALRRTVNGREAAFLDGPAGTQVPQVVIDAIGRYLIECNANLGGRFTTSHLTDRWMEAVHASVATFLGTDDPGTVVFGPNMTSHTLALSRALARGWQSGDEILLSHSEHDANFTPWKLAAADAGVHVRYIDLNPEDGTLDLGTLDRQLTERTKLVAVGCASNATGTRHPVAEICRRAKHVGALTFLDGVHLAPHDLIDVQSWGCDFFACSAYKFFGPHQGILWGRREHLESLEPYKLRPAPNSLPGRWMTGTQNHECMAGTQAAVEYLESIGRDAANDYQLPSRDALRSCFEHIVRYERQLIWRLIDGLGRIDGLRIWGITDPSRADERLPTISFTLRSFSSAQIAAWLGEQGYFVWHGNYYALPLTERLGLEPDGMVRVGLVHYNTRNEVDGLIDSVHQLLATK